MEKICETFRKSLSIFRYYPRSNEFSELLAKGGMYRNYSLNTVMDKSRVQNSHL